MRMARSKACGHVPVCQLSGGARWQTHLPRSSPAQKASRRELPPDASPCGGLPVHRRHSPHAREVVLMDGHCRVRAVTHGLGRAPEAPLPTTPAAPVPLEPLGGVLRAEQDL